MDLLQCYQKLGLKPECGWKELQSGYRRLVQKWHPDRYQQHPDQQHVAAHRMLEINEAYGILAQYYRQHGQLPFEPARRRSGGSGGAAFETDAGSELDFDAQLHSVQARMARSRLFDLLPWVIVASILALGYYYLSVYRDAGTLKIDDGILLGDNFTVPSAAPKPAPPPNTAFFTYGDPPGRVYEVQGVPTRTEGGLWLYGESEVYFENGVVASWHSAPGHPLRVHDKPGRKHDTSRKQH
ncbi:MAG TPA: DnaJ domain-containing protein [Gammaproteobacteria bacterium]